MVLSGAEYWMAVMAAFPLSLVVRLSSVSFFIDIDILDFFSNYSYIFFALPSKGTSNMPRTESSSAVSQDYLDFYYLSSAILFLGSILGPQCKNGRGPQIIGPHIYILQKWYINLSHNCIQIEIIFFSWICIWCICSKICIVPLITHFVLHVGKMVHSY